MEDEARSREHIRVAGLFFAYFLPKTSNNAQNGRKTDDLVREAVDRFLDDETRFAEAIKLGLAAAENGDFVASEEVWAGVERALKS